MATVVTRRARIEEIRPLADEFAAEQAGDGVEGEQPLPQGGVFWIAEDAAEGTALGYAAGALGQDGCTIGPVFVRSHARERGVGRTLLGTIQQWAADTRVPVVEISVSVANDDGRRFLEALGYEPRRVLMSLTPKVPVADG